MNPSRWEVDVEDFVLINVHLFLVWVCKLFDCVFFLEETVPIFNDGTHVGIGANGNADVGVAKNYVIRVVEGNSIVCFLWVRSDYHVFLSQAGDETFLILHCFFADAFLGISHQDVVFLSLFWISYEADDQQNMRDSVKVLMEIFGSDIVHMVHQLRWTYFFASLFLY